MNGVAKRPWPHIEAAISLAESERSRRTLHAIDQARMPRPNDLFWRELAAQYDKRILDPLQHGTEPSRLGERAHRFRRRSQSDKGRDPMPRAPEQNAQVLSPCCGLGPRKLIDLLRSSFELNIKNDLSRQKIFVRRSKPPHANTFPQAESSTPQPQKQELVKELKLRLAFCPTA